MIYSSSDPCRVGFLIVYIELCVVNKWIMDTTKDAQRRFASSLMMGDIGSDSDFSGGGRRGGWDGRGGCPIGVGAVVASV
jgi:hypothetical protein